MLAIDSDRTASLTLSSLAINSKFCKPLLDLNGSFGGEAISKVWVLGFEVNHDVGFLNKIQVKSK